MSERASEQRSSSTDQGIQAFLDRASPLILERGAVDEGAFNSLNVIREQAGLDRVQFLSILAEMERRDVVQFTWRPTDWPAPATPDEKEFVESPSNGRSRGTSSDLSDGSSSVEASSLASDEESKLRRSRRRHFQKEAARIIARHGEMTFELRAELMTAGEALGLSRRQVEAAIDKLAASHKKNSQEDTEALIATNLPQPPSGDRGIVFVSSTQPSPPPVVAPPPVIVPRDSTVDRDEPIESFQGEARRILAENRGMTARGRLMLADAAHDLGLTESDFDEALASLGVDVKEALPPQPSNAESVEPEKIRPEDSYRTYLRIAIADKKLSRGVISENAERKMVNEGSRKLDLSSVWARQLLREVARQLDVPLVSDQKPLLEDGEEVPIVATFSTRAKPILAQFRGLNAQSRVRLSALADELGLTEVQRQQALSLLQASASNESDSAIEMRRDAYREFVEDFFAEMSHGILSPALELELAESGEMRYGVDRSSAGEIVRSSAENAGIATISSDQAYRHLESLIGEQVGANTVAPSDVRELLHAEGEQWGIEPDDVSELIKARCQQNRRKRQRERRTTNLVLAFACFAVVILFAVFFWIVVFDAEWPLRLPASEPIHSPAANGDDETDVVDRLTPEKVETWWSSDLRIRAAKLRGKLSTEHRGILASIRSLDDDIRGTAYEKLIAKYHADDLPLSVEVFLVRCFAEDIATDVARRLAEAMLNPIPAVGVAVPENDKELALNIRVIDWVEQVIAAEDVSTTRVDLLSDVVLGSLSVSINKGISRDERRQTLKTALARRLYENLLTLATTDPLKAFKLSGIIVAMARKELPRLEFDRLGIRLFRSTLEEEGVDSIDFDSLLSEIIGETDDSSVLRELVEMLRTSETGEIRDLLESRLLRRAGLAPDGSLKSADRITEELGLKKSTDKPSTPEDRWTELRELIEPAFSTLVSEPRNVSSTIESVIRASYFQALVTAMLVDPSGREYRKLVERGEDSFQPDLDFARVFGFEGSSPRFIGGKNVKSYTDRIRNNRTEVKRRSAFMGLVRNADSFDDLEPAYAEIIGDYLAIRRDRDDVETLLPHVDEITHWHNVRLALGRKLAEDPFYNDAMQLLVEKLTGQPLDAPQNDRWGGHAQLALIESVVRDLEKTEADTGEDMMSSFAISAVQVDKELIRLLGPVSELADDVTPAGTSRALIAATAERFAVDNKSDEYEAWMQSLPHELVASDSLDVNELQRTVMYDRIRINTLAQAALASDVDADRVDELRQAATKMDREANDVMDQLVDGRVVQLKLLMLMMEKSVK